MTNFKISVVREKVFTHSNITKQQYKFTPLAINLKPRRGGVGDIYGKGLSLYHEPDATERKQLQGVLFNLSGSLQEMKNGRRCRE